MVVEEGEEAADFEGFFFVVVVFFYLFDFVDSF